MESDMAFMLAGERTQFLGIDESGNRRWAAYDDPFADPAKREAMNKPHISPVILPPTSTYSHAIEVPGKSRLLFVSGQIPVAPDGTCSTDFAEQARQCWRNLAAVLACADMELSDLVRVQAFVTRREHLQAYRDIRNRIVESTRPAHTLLVVSSLGRPEWLVEMEAVAAKSD
jgi:enamine deaminase RidA (YjgF/YER057c/UK114 family)